MTSAAPVIIGIGARTPLGFNRAASAAAAPTDAVDTNRRTATEDAGVRFSSVTPSPDGAATGVTYLYRISDPAEPYPVQETADTHASVRPVSGRTCVEVVARDAEGTSSEAAVACVDTPGAQGGQ